jgi:hypothetical protein
MIQRIQSVWLLLAAACGFAMSKIPVFEATLSTNVVYNLLATESLLLFAIIMGVACVAVICIFLFKNRPLQFKLVIVSIVLSIAAIAIEVWKVEDYKSINASSITRGTYYWGGLLPIIMIGLLIAAARAIYKDEKLVKSLDRLR